MRGVDREKRRESEREEMREQREREKEREQRERKRKMNERNRGSESKEMRTQSHLVTDWRDALPPGRHPFRRPLLVSGIRNSATPRPLLDWPNNGTTI